MDIGKENPAVVVQPVKLPYPLRKKEKEFPIAPEPVITEPIKEPIKV